ncbi:hypothetical protein EMCG_00007 [[Emmonsia] crescens]|uniref:Uncharacterized protein n=1 Tax=[Emmonsia] crescens TaxID=73230 RepID=A0A0G2JC94_9EURO|nr:hypothetical protein EMCG_00007 [Emmonsia crescens UAMH 3008]
MWRSNVTREHLLQKISLLAMLGPIRDGSKIHTLKTIDDIHDTGRSLTIEQEGEIIDNLAFLSYRRKNCRNITALCMQEDEDGEGMLVRLAVNGDAPAHIENGLQKICMALEEVAQRNNRESYDVEMFFQEIIKLDLPRISARLKLGAKYSIDKSRAVKLHRVLHQHSLTQIEPIGLAALQEKSNAFLDLYRQLKFSSASQSPSAMWDVMTQLLKLAHELGQSRSLAAALDQPLLDTVEKDALLDWLRKLGQYYKASHKLVLAARRKWRLFQQIRVETFQVEVPNEVRLPSRPGSALPLIQSLRDSTDVAKLLQRFRGSESRADTALLQRLDRTRPSIKVHAEIKLLFYYESHPEIKKPRVICANKDACYLCDLFFKVHGQFQVLRTFGKLNERWILPDWLNDLPEDRLSFLKATIEEFSSCLDSLIIRILRHRERRPDPMESTLCLSARWSNSTIGKLTFLQGLRGKERPSTTAIQSSSSHPSQNIETRRSSGATSPSGSCSSVFIAKHYLPSETRFSECEVLRPGATVEKRLGVDRSFLLTVEKCCVILSFNAAVDVSCSEGEELRAHVHLLSSEEKVDSDNVPQDVTPLKGIQEGTELTIECGEKRSQQIFYVSWRNEVIAIYYTCRHG